MSTARASSVNSCLQNTDQNSMLYARYSAALYTRYPIVARALGLAAARCILQPLGRVRARANVSCIQSAGKRARDDN